jgi:SagB-type dehydrogenase family enzyme
MDLAQLHATLTASPDPVAGGVQLTGEAGAEEVVLVKEYPGAATVPLPPPRPGRCGLALDRAVAERASCYAFAPDPVDPADLSDLLHVGAGVKRLAETPIGTVPVRMAPSAGSLQPVNVYVAASRVAGLPAGLYHYNPVRHDLDRLSDSDPRPALEAGCMQGFVATSPVALVLTCSLDRVLWHYGTRAYRSVHLDAGVLAQNLMLVATALGLGSCAVFGFFDRVLDELIGADGRDEFTTLVLAVGRQSPAVAASGPPARRKLGLTNSIS